MNDSYKIVVIGTGYVGLVTGVTLAEIGHQVRCVDINEEKIDLLNQGICPIFEPGLEEMMNVNVEEGRLSFTSDLKEAMNDTEVVYVAVGTPEKEDGSADLTYIEQAARQIGLNMNRDLTVVTKSTVPVHTHRKMKEWISREKSTDFILNIVSNPEFLREGSSLQDTFQADRIVIGAENESTFQLMEKINAPFSTAIFRTDLASAEMIKYASNAFLATKISFINEIANLCEKLEANVDDVAAGMGLDHRIGNHFLQAGIGYGGSCFPKDTKALAKIASHAEYEFTLLKAVIERNQSQQLVLLEKARMRFDSLSGKRVAILGLSFKPNTDDMRESPAIAMIDQLVSEGAKVQAYDPVAIENAKKWISSEIAYHDDYREALRDADMAFIVTDWSQLKEMDLNLYRELMKTPVIFDGRNIYPLADMQNLLVEYYSIGRKSVK
jgi:UDPglucose 6-dehydrogenase